MALHTTSGASRSDPPSTYLNGVTVITTTLHNNIQYIVNNYDHTCLHVAWNMAVCTSESSSLHVYTKRIRSYLSVQCQENQHCKRMAIDVDTYTVYLSLSCVQILIASLSWWGHQRLSTEKRLNINLQIMSCWYTIPSLVIWEYLT